LAIWPRGIFAGAIPDFEYRPAQLPDGRGRSSGPATPARPSWPRRGTGTGKTLAYLVPAILSGKKTVVATGTKTLQEQLFFKDIPLLARALPKRFVAAS